MLKTSTVNKYIKYLVVAAVLLPLVFIAEVTYVERQHTKGISQAQNEEITKRKAEVEAEWLSNQVDYVKAIAKLSAATVGGETAVVNTEFHSLLTANFIALGYAGNDGKIKTDTSGNSERDISNQNYFMEAAAGREFTGQVPGADWLLDQAVTVVAVPVIANGEITGVVYGVISRDIPAAVSATLVFAASDEQQTVMHWLAWLVGVYFVGVIPLLLLVCLLYRNKLYVEDSAALKCKEFVESTIIETPDVVAVKKIAEMIALNTADTTPAADNAFADTAEPGKFSVDKILGKTAAATADRTPAEVIDRVLAVAAYKGIKPAPKQAPVIFRKAAQETRTNPEKTLEPTVLAPAVQKTPNEELLPDRDALTGLYTQSAFEKKLAAQQGQPDKAIVVLSIDGMKVINDFLGNQAGDTIITVTAGIIKTVAGLDLAARVDGDRFVALLAGVSSDMLDDIKKDIKYYIDLHNLRQPELPLSITIGAIAANQGESLTTVWEKAERDMDSHKAVNRVEARKFIMLSIKRYRQKP